MKLQDVPFGFVDWNKIIPDEHPGETGSALWRTIEKGNVRIRIVEYSPGYLADHWCSRGHIILVLEGELITELQDGSIINLYPGMSYHVADNEVPHRSRTTTGAKLFIVD
jgi:quercetin dioxygenase-like cupin family protein